MGAAGCCTSQLQTELREKRRKIYNIII